jgi:hypothetical protein
MRIRARHVHAFEGFLDNVIGLAINFAAVLLIYNGIFDHKISVGENVVGGFIMFWVAWARKYTIRRWANQFIDKLYKRYKAEEDAAQIQEQTGAN